MMKSRAGVALAALALMLAGTACSSDLQSPAEVSTPSDEMSITAQAEDLVIGDPSTGRLRAMADRLDKVLRFSSNPGDKLPASFYLDQRGKHFRADRIGIYNPSLHNYKYPSLRERGMNPSAPTDLLLVSDGKQHPESNNGAWVDKYDREHRIISAMGGNSFNLDDRVINMAYTSALKGVRLNGAMSLKLTFIGTYVGVTLSDELAEKFPDVVPVRMSITGVGIDDKVSFDPMTNDVLPVGTPSSEPKTIDYPVQSTEHQSIVETPLIAWFGQYGKTPTTLKYEIEDKEGNLFYGEYVDFKAGIQDTYLLICDQVKPKVTPRSDEGHDLIITEFSHDWRCNAEYSWIEITNGSDDDIDLRDYSLWREDMCNNGVKYGFDFATLLSDDCVTRVKQWCERSTILPAHKSLVILADDYNKCGYYEGLTRFATQYFYGRNYEQNIFTQGEDCWDAIFLNPCKTGTKYNDLFYIGGRACNRWAYSAFFLCKGGNNTTLGESNDIVDNFGRTADGRYLKFLTAITYLRLVPMEAAPGYEQYTIPESVTFPFKDYVSGVWQRTGRPYTWDLGQYRSNMGYNKSLYLTDSWLSRPTRR